VGETLEILGRNGLASIGTGSSRSQAEAPQILERHGIRIGFFGATDIFNSNLNGAESGPWVNALDVERLAAAVRQLRPRVDAVVVSLHWGEEYRHLPSQRQRDVAARLVEAGVDLVIGHHPHVLQPLAWVEAGGRRGAVAYSLGNFISNQDRTYNPAHMAVQAGDSRDGAALKATWVKDAAGSAHLAGVTMEPLWTENNALRPAGARRAIRVVRIGQRTGPLAELRQRRIQDVLAGVAAPPPVRLAKVARRPVLRVPLPPPAPSPEPEPPGAELPGPVPAEAPIKAEALP